MNRRIFRRYRTAREAIEGIESSDTTGPYSVSFSYVADNPFVYNNLRKALLYAQQVGVTVTNTNVGWWKKEGMIISRSDDWHSMRKFLVAIEQLCEPK